MSSYCLLAENAYIKMVSDTMSQTHGHTVRGLFVHGGSGFISGMQPFLPIRGLWEKDQQHMCDSTRGLEASSGVGPGADELVNCILEERKKRQDLGHVRSGPGRGLVSTAGAPHAPQALSRPGRGGPVGAHHTY